MTSIWIVVVLFFEPGAAAPSSMTTLYASTGDVCEQWAESMTREHDSGAYTGAACIERPDLSAEDA